MTKVNMTGDYQPWWSHVAFKGGSAPPPPNPMAEAQAQIAVKDYENNLQRQRDAEQRRRDREQHAKDTKRFKGDTSRAITGARDYFTNQINERGIVDTYGIGSNFNQRLRQARQSVPDLATDVGAYIDPKSLWDQAYNEELGLERNSYNKQFNEFAGNGFDTKLIADTADDALVGNILDAQYKEALGGIDRAKARGQLNDIGYSHALTALGGQKSAGSSKLQDLGLGVLNKYRTNLRSTAQGYKDQINNYDFGDAIDLAGWRGELEGGANKSLMGLEGDLRGALGSTDLFDLDLLLGRAGTAQGVVNPVAGTAPLLAQFTGRTAEEEAARKRTLGSVGAF